MLVRIIAQFIKKYLMGKVSTGPCYFIFVVVVAVAAVVVVVVVVVSVVFVQENYYIALWGWALWKMQTTGTLVPLVL